MGYVYQVYMEQEWGHQNTKSPTQKKGQASKKIKKVPILYTQKHCAVLIKMGHIPYNVIQAKELKANLYRSSNYIIAM